MLEKTKETKNKVAAAKNVEKWEKLDAELTKILSKTGLDKYKKWSQVLRNKTKCQWKISGKNGLNHRKSPPPQKKKIENTEKKFVLMNIVPK